MTREEIKNTPELVDFMIDKSVIVDSRKKLRKRMDEICNLAIKALEQTSWIPCSEILPEIHQDVILSLRSLDVAIGFRAETEPYFYCDGSFIESQNVLAWMPLPKPYKEERR